MDKGSNLLLTLSKQITGYSPEIDRFSITMSNSILLSVLFSVMIIESYEQDANKMKREISEERKLTSRIKQIEEMSTNSQQQT